MQNTIDWEHEHSGNTLGHGHGKLLCYDVVEYKVPNRSPHNWMFALVCAQLLGDIYIYISDTQHPSQIAIRVQQWCRLPFNQTNEARTRLGEVLPPDICSVQSSGDLGFLRSWPCKHLVDMQLRAAPAE